MRQEGFTDTIRPECVFWLDGPRELADAVEAHPTRTRAHEDSDANWCGGTWEDALRFAREGDTAGVARMQSYLDQVNVQVESNRPGWVASPAGAFPIVPEAIMGRPDPMRRRVMLRSEFAPVRVFVNLSSWGGVPASALEVRGAAILALVARLSASRPVELWALAGGGPDGGVVSWVCPLGVAPLNLSEVSGVLCCPVVKRRLGHAFLWQRCPSLDGSLPFPWNLARTEDLPTVEVRYRALLGLSDSDVFIGAAQAGEKSARDPVGFVRDELLRISGRDSIEEE